MYKWIALVATLVASSLMTTGLVSALLDLGAFVVLLVVVIRRALRQKALKVDESQVTKQAESRSEKIDITP